jgi:transcriptional regulator with XRE-family HTH domain
MDIRGIFAENLKGARRAKGWSQEELAHHADIDRTYVSSLERGVYAASIDMIEQLANALDLQPWQMLQPRENDRNSD